MVRSSRIPTVLLVVLTLLAACGQSGGTTAGTASTTAAVPPSTAPITEATSAAAPSSAGSAATAAPAETAASTGAADGLLAEVKQRGKLLIATDANYKPQSFKNADGSWEGFDIDVGREVAKRLGVEAEFMDISFDVITAGSWNGRWDINVGSMTVTAERKKALLFSPPYYYTPASFAVHKDSKLTSIDELAGKNVGVGTATTYLDYLNGTLSLEGETIIKPAPKATAKTYDTDQLALTDLALGDGARLDAALTALPTIQDAIKGGQPFKVLGDPVYYEDLAIAIDQKSPQDPASLAAAISKIIDDMHKDGTLTALSQKYYGSDLTTKK